MSSLNCLEEVQLAESLIKLHPQFDMVKFAKTGGEGPVAIRIARAAAGETRLQYVDTMGGMIGTAAGLNKGVIKF